MLLPAGVTPAFVVSTVMVAFKVTGPVKLTVPPGLLVVVRFPLKLMAVGAV
jgi:hypothetical protein